MNRVTCNAHGTRSACGGTIAEDNRRITVCDTSETVIDAIEILLESL